MSSSANVQRLLRLRSRGLVQPPIAAATRSTTTSSNLPSMAGGIITTLFYLSSFLFILFLILTFINFTIYPIFKLSPHDKGFISVATDPVQTAWTKTPPKPEDHALITTPLSTDYTISFDVYVNSAYSTVKTPLFVLYRNDGSTPVSISPYKSPSDLFPKSNLLVMIDPSKNDMKIIAMTNNSTGQKKHKGDSCRANTDCYSNSCLGNTCAAGNVGDACGVSNDCMSGYTCLHNPSGEMVCTLDTTTANNIAAQAAAVTNAAQNGCTAETAATIAAAAAAVLADANAASATTTQSYPETVATITNIPVGSVFRLTIVYMFTFVEVYIDGKLRATKILNGMPITSLNDFWPPPDNSTVQVGTFYYWSRVLPATEIQALLPVADQKFFGKT